MEVNLISAKMLYDDAFNGYQNSPVKYYKQNSSIYPHIKELFIKAMNNAGEDFISYKTAKIVTRTYYKTRLQEAGVKNPTVVAKAVADFATVYNLSKSIPAKGFSLPDFSRLSDVVDFLGSILKKIIAVGIITGIGAGIILIIGGLLLIPDVLSTFTNSVSTDVSAIVGALCELRNITVEHDDLIRWLEMEESFQQLVTGKDSHECDFSAGSYISLLDELHHQKNRMIDLEALLAASRRSEEPEISLCLVNHGIAQSVDLAVIEASSNLEADDDSPEDEEFVNSQTEESNVQEVKISAGLQPASFQ